jgi:hypothetical protein
MGGPRLMRSGRARRRTQEGLASKFAALRWVAIGTPRQFVAMPKLGSYWM